jgi:hypothetical protein
MQAILAPVPCLHLVGALEVIGKHGVVAFGSQAGFFFLNDDGGGSYLRGGTNICTGLNFSRRVWMCLFSFGHLPSPHSQWCYRR